MSHCQPIANVLSTNPKKLTKNCLKIPCMAKLNRLVDSPSNQLDELDRITHACFGFTYSLTQAQEMF